MVNPTSTPTAQAEPTATEATSTLSPTATPAPQSSTSEAEGNGSTEAAEASLRIVAEKGLGEILVDGKGMTLYIYTKDEPDKSNCTGDCLVKWSPLLTQGNPVLGTGVDGSLVGTATLADDRMIVTYNKMPLYYWYQDIKPEDAFGQGVGNVWYVIRWDGTPVIE